MRGSGLAHIRTPIKIGESVRVRNVAPKLGQHNAEIFSRLGVSSTRASRNVSVQQGCASGNSAGVVSRT
jgi:crotonobetainyl-CoA:carnitine CoA-transferase CaiB-like acyl-CoA transferase